jgi:hypothetical protein
LLLDALYFRINILHSKYQHEGILRG